MGTRLDNTGSPAVAEPLSQRPGFVEQIEAQRPHGYPSITSWVFAGVSRFPVASGVALACGWLNLYLAVFLAVLFAVLGALVGLIAGLGASVFLGRGIGAETLTGVGFFSGLVDGLVQGFTIGLIGPWSLQAQINGPGAVVIGFAVQIVSALVLAGLLTVGYLVFEPWILRMRGYRRMSRREAARIMPLARLCAQRLQLSNLPGILIDDTPLINAHATMRHIVINRGIYRELEDDDEALAGIIAHELAHWASGDAVGIRFVWSLAFPVTFTYSLAVRLVESGSSILSLIGYVVGWPLLLLVRFAILPALGGRSRQIEYACDQAAMRAGFRAGMYRAHSILQDRFEEGANGWERTLARTHPPFELRLERLEPETARQTGELPPNPQPATFRPE
jgi:Zn-dependent protease with chaperone function